VHRIFTGLFVAKRFSDAQLSTQAVPTFDHERSPRAAITLPSDAARREISSSLPRTTGRHLFKIGNRLPTVTFS
jgi:DNA-binding IclR family transcriptional regulator